MSDYPPMEDGIPFADYAAKRLDEAIDILLEQAGISEEELRIPRPHVEYDLFHPSAYKPWTNTVIISPEGLGHKPMYGEEAAHWLFHSVCPDEALIEFDCRDLSDPNWKKFCNLHEMLGRYGSNILTNGKPAEETRNYSRFDGGHRIGYRTADAIWKDKGSGLFHELLTSTLDEILALVDIYGFSIK